LELFFAFKEKNKPNYPLPSFLYPFKIVFAFDLVQRYT